MRVFSWFIVGSFFLAGCESGATVYGPCQPSEYGLPGCPYPEEGGGGAGGEGGAGGAGGEGGAGGAGGGDETACAGDCVAPAPLGWFGPALLWYGPPDQAPDCPAAAPNVGYQGFADLAPVPLACAACLCDPPAAASCELPLDWSAYAATCAVTVPGTAVTSFAAPEGWDGTCTAVNAIPAGQDCGGQPCVQWLSIDAPAVVVPSACTPRVDEPPPPARLDPWQTRALACVPGAYTECASDRSTCMPTPGQPGVPPPGGFLTCIFHEGDVTCEAPYLDRHVFYGGAEDTRGCSECGCGEPEGASCTVMASVYSDGACGALLVSAVVSSTTPFCGVTPPGVALGSKSAEVVAVDPGGCASSGGEPLGELLPAEPSTFCCQA
ncbi:hypothetical protein [Sorangium atrum]|uniref:Uncharacterized protein n=1 Tax=Sorangium atrum TaxID=2995308 RepID=A0ABT5C8X1_9BACT|nr:hypothetical protein [Sorangium aterium]MDC0682873.1 hypothetical protein [Sorangium aterium]